MRIVYASYSDALARAEELEAALDTFAETPSADTLVAAKNAWGAARHPYLQTEAYRFYAGPIDDKDGLESMINGWPLDEYHIDYVEGAPEAGIINDPELHPEISKTLIADLNEKAGETAITSGFHAIEFLLWGQDHSDDGPGNRPVSDYTTSKQADRRAAYLLSCGDLLTDHLGSLVSDWEPGRDDNFRGEFEKMNPVDAVRQLLYGIQVMSGKELAGERLLVAWDTGDQEDEHSCFSDTTHLDVQGDALGIENVYRGRYRDEQGKTISGTGVRALVRTLLPEQLEDYDGKMNEIMKAVKAIPAPFDQAVLGEEEAPGRKAILTAVEHLEDFAAMLSALDRRLLTARKGG